MSDLGIDVSIKYIGLREIENRVKIMDLLKSQSHNGDILIDPKTTPWCAAWVNFCERTTGRPGTGKLNARSFRTYGEEIWTRGNPKTKWNLGNIKRGDILVFERGSNGYSGHVTYYDRREDDGTWLCLGGNQNDMVCINRYTTDRLLSIRRS